LAAPLRRSESVSLSFHLSRLREGQVRSQSAAGEGSPHTDSLIAAAPPPQPSPAKGGRGSAASLRPRPMARHSRARPRPAARYARAFVQHFRPPNREGVGNAGRPMRPRPVCNVVAHGSHRRSPEITRHSRTRLVLTAYSALSPATNSSCHRHRRIEWFCANPVGREKPPPT
jgi:hypothetical protein